MIAIRDDRLAVPEGDGSMGTKNQELADYFIDAAEGKRSGAVAGSDRRIKKRVPYNALVAMVGLQFVPMAAELSSDSFLDKTGRMALLDPSLKADAA